MLMLLFFQAAGRMKCSELNTTKLSCSMRKLLIISLAFRHIYCSGIRVVTWQEKRICSRKGICFTIKFWKMHQAEKRSLNATWSVLSCLLVPHSTGILSGSYNRQQSSSCLLAVWQVLEQAHEPWILEHNFVHLQSLLTFPITRFLRNEPNTPET